MSDDTIRCDQTPSQRMKVSKQQNTEEALDLLSLEVQQRVEVIQQLLAAQGSERYGQVQQQAALKLGR